MEMDVIPEEERGQQEVDFTYYMWRVLHKPLSNLFQCLPNAESGLRAFMISIIDSKREFYNVLTPCAALADLTKEILSFDKWLLGRLFYIFSIRKLERLFNVNVKCHSKILSVLFANNASFYIDVCDEYIKCNKKLIKHLGDLENENYNKKVLHLRVFIPDLSTIPAINLDLSPITIDIYDADTCKIIIRHLSDILFGIVVSAKDLRCHTIVDEVISQCFYIIENFSIDLKVTYIQLFLRLLDDSGSFLDVKYLCKFLSLLESLVLTMPAIYKNCSLHTFGQIEKLNFQIAEAMRKLQYYNISQNQSCRYAILNICEFVLNANNSNRESRKSVASDAVSVFLPELKKSCSELLEIYFNEKTFTLSNDAETLEYYLENVPCLLVNGIKSDVDKYFYANANEVLVKNTETIEKSGLAKELFDIFALSLRNAQREEIDLIIINANLKRCLSVLYIFQDVFIAFCSDRQNKNGSFKLLHNMRKSREINFSLELFSVERFRIIVKGVMKILEELFRKNTEPAAEICMCIDICMMLLIFVDNMCLEDFSAIIQIECFLLNKKQKFIEISPCKVYSNHFHTDIHLHVLKVLLVQNLHSVKLNEIEDMKKYISDCLTFLQLRNTNIHSQILLQFPLLMINKIVSLKTFIENYLYTALCEDDEKLLDTSISILPLVTCISYGNYILVKSKHNVKIDSIGYRVTSVDGMHLYLICLHCYDKKLPDYKNVEMAFKDKNMFMLNDSGSKQIVEVMELNCLFAKFPQLNFYKKVEITKLHKFIVTLSRHSIFIPSLINYITIEKNLLEITPLLRFFFTNILNDEKLIAESKNEYMNIFITALLKRIKLSLEKNDIDQQDNCLEAIRQFGLSQSTKSLLPSVKMLIYFLIYYNCTLSSKAIFYLKEICESHSLSPNSTYHKYKKDFCRIAMEVVAHNFLLGHDFISSILNFVCAFGFISIKEFIFKEMHHALPYLIPNIVKSEKLKEIVPKIANYITCTPSDFLNNKFPYIYTHVYIYESETVAKKCYQYIESITGVRLIDSIKKHSLIILTELLLQYCCDPEKVIKACKKLFCIDNEISENQESTTSLTQVVDYIQPKLLGVIVYFNRKLTTTKIALSVKRKVLQSLPHIFDLMGSKHITPLRYKILSTLRTALSTLEEFHELKIKAWDAFLRNTDTISLGSLLSTIVISLLTLIPITPNEVNNIFEYLIVKNENLLCDYIGDLFFLEMTDASPSIKTVVKRHVKRNQPERFIDKLQWYMQYLNQDMPEIKVYALKYLHKLIKRHRKDLDSLIFNNKTTNKIVFDLLEIFIIGCRSKDNSLAEWSGRCLGQIGALHPSLLFHKSTSSRNETQFAFSMTDLNFAKMALFELTRAFQFEKHTNDMDCYSLAIQEILHSFSINPDGDNKDVWFSFPEHLHQIMIPLLSSSYNLGPSSNPSNHHPIFGSPSASTFSDWGFNWAGKLIPKVNQKVIHNMLRMVHPAMKRDLQTLILFLPYIVLHAVFTNDNVDFIKEEIMSVIQLSLFNVEKVNVKVSNLKIMRYVNLTPVMTPSIAEEGTHIKCCIMLYNIFDFLNRWLMEWNYKSMHTSQDPNYLKIKQFVHSFCKLTIARGNVLCGELERALQYLEMYMEESPEQFQAHLGFLAEIYSVLNEPDPVAGIMSLKQSEPTLSELILAHEVTGQLQDAATCYEKCARQANIDNDKLRGMVDIYLDLDQPYTALKLLEGADLDDEALAAEPYWRLGMFEELEKLLNSPKIIDNDSWGVNVGNCLLALRNSKRDVFEEKLKATRFAILRILDGGANYLSEEESIYSRSYTSAFYLHIISEIEHIEELVSKIKNLSDDDVECSTVLNCLIEEWDLRFKLLQTSANTIEPVLMLRRILLEQSKELLKDTHPGIVPLFDVHIGKLWLQSVKLARKAGVYHQAYMYILSSEKYAPKELFIEKAKLYWMRNNQEPAFCTLKRGLEKYSGDISRIPENERKLCAKAKLLIAIYNCEMANVDVDVNINHYKDAVETYKTWEKSLVCLGEYYEKLYTTLSPEDKKGSSGCRARYLALECYGKSLQYGHKRLYQSMPRMLTIWLDFEMIPEYKSESVSALRQMCSCIETFTNRLPLYLFVSAFSQIISRICHPIQEVYTQLKSIIIKLILAYPQHSLWMMMCVIKSSYPQRVKRCRDILNSPLLKEPSVQKFISDFDMLAENLIDLCNKPIGNVKTINVSTLVRNLPKIFATTKFSQIMMPHEQFVKLSLPFTAISNVKDYNPFPSLVYIEKIEEEIVVLPSLQRPRKVTFRGSDGKRYNVMLKPKDDLRKDFRLMEFNAVVNRYLQEDSDARERRLYIRTYTVLPLNEECGLIEWIPNLVGLRPILNNIYKTKGIAKSTRELRSLFCDVKDSLTKKKAVFENQLLPAHPPVFGEWFRFTFHDPHSWFRARCAYTRTTAVISMVGYILGLGDRHGENILFDSNNGDTVHVDFNCLFNKGEELEWPERVPFRLTHNMRAAMGPLGHEGMFRKSCEITMRVLKAQTPILMAVIRPFVYDPLVSWQKMQGRMENFGEKTNESAKENLMRIEQRLQGMVHTKKKQFTLSLSPEGQTNNLILEAINVENLCQMFPGWGAFL